MSMRIEIDGSPLQRPSYAHELSDGQYTEYLKNALQFKELGHIFAWEGGRVGGVREDILDRMAHDPDFYSYVASVVKQGEGFDVSRFSSQIADSLADSGQVLELVPKRPSSEAGEPFPRIGTFLKKGTVIFRGDVGEVSALRGGTLYIDGNVDKLNQCPTGIVYVNGDVNHLQESEKAIVVVAGRVNKYVQYRRSGGGLNREVTPSPFIFTSHPLEVETPDNYRGRDIQVPENTSAELSPSFVIPEARLKGWLPEATQRQALELCVERIGSHFEDLKRVAGGITDASTMAQFARFNLQGFVEGSSSGYYKGSHDATPASAYD